MECCAQACLTSASRIVQGNVFEWFFPIWYFHRRDSSQVGLYSCKTSQLECCAKACLTSASLIFQDNPTLQYFHRRDSSQVGLYSCKTPPLSWSAVQRCLKSASRIVQGNVFQWISSHMVFPQKGFHPSSNIFLQDSSF